MRFAPHSDVLACDSRLDERLEETPLGAAVFAIHTGGGEPYVGHTKVLRRRLKRLLREREQPARTLNLRSVARAIEYWPVHSRLESWLVLYEVARLHRPAGYIEFLKLRMPPYLKLVLGNPFPRTQITTKLTGGPGQFYGPFRSRAAAEQFEHDLLDLFQMRRCQEDLAPAPDHPGCIYGEMGLCLRPCQQVVGQAEYASEVARVSEFLKTGGACTLHATEAARERMSAELEFEEAARLHKRVERIQALLKYRDEAARDLDQHNGVAITPGSDPGRTLLWFLRRGAWMPPVPFEIAQSAATISMDRRLRDLFSALGEAEEISHRERQEHMAIFARWFYSSWRDGAYIPIESLDKPPYRRIVAAISRTVHQSAPAASH